MRGDFDEDEDPNFEPQMTKPKTPKALDAVADIVLAYRPTAKSKPAVQRKRRATILKNAQSKKKGGG